MTQTDQDAARLLRGHLSGYWKAQVAAAAAQLNLPEQMSGRTVEASALARQLKLHPDSLFRLLRAMAAIGLARDEGERRFSLTPAGALLKADAPGSMRGMALHIGTQLWPAWGQLAEAVRKGAPPPGIKHGPHGFAELNDEPEQAAIFNQSMVDGSGRIGQLAAQAYDFSQFNCVMDVGGGYGAVLAALLEKYPKLSGLILDLPHAEQGAKAYLDAQGVGSRARYMTGSFFDEIPPDADCYVLKFIIHDWNDDYAAKIMARVGAAARQSHGTVILVERPLPEHVETREDHAGACQGDLTMMLWDGKERTLADYRALFSAAGLTLSLAVPIGEGFSVIEGRPAAAN